MNTNKILECLDSIDVAATDARMCILESCINLDKKYTLMEQNGVTLGSNDPIVQSFIDNRYDMIPQYIDETAKGRRKTVVAMATGCIIGMTVGSFLIAYPILSFYSTSLIPFTIAFAGDYVLALIGGALGIKVADSLRRKNIRNEIIKDMSEVTSNMLAIVPKVDGTFDIDKKTRKSLYSLTESIDSALRTAPKLDPPMSAKEKELYLDVKTSSYEMITKKDQTTAKKFMDAMNKACKECMTISGIDTKKVESEFKDAVKKTIAEEKSNGPVSEYNLSIDIDAVYFDESSKGRGTRIASGAIGGVIGHDIAIALIARPALMVLFWEGAPALGYVGAMVLGAATIGTAVGIFGGLKLSDWIRRKGARQEFMRDADKLSALLLIATTKYNDRIEIDKDTNKAIKNILETIKMMIRQKIKIDPPMTPEEITAYDNVTDAVNKFKQDPCKRTADECLDVLNKAVDVCLKVSGIDTSELKKESKKKLEEYIKNNKEGEKNNDT